MLISLVNNRPSSKNFTNSDSLQEWTRATNIRFRLLRTKSLLGHLMALSRQDPSVTRRVSINKCMIFYNILYYKTILFSISTVFVIYPSVVDVCAMVMQMIVRLKI